MRKASLQFGNKLVKDSKDGRSQDGGPPLLRCIQEAASMHALTQACVRVKSKPGQRQTELKQDQAGKDDVGWRALAKGCRDELWRIAQPAEIGFAGRCLTQKVWQLERTACKNWVLQFQGESVSARLARTSFH
eukprot:1137260-Pelagomonas_calceolata.AAC.8